ncbi:MAG: LdpA C-terminal domain-containing domain [Geitlerinemataceae cyanobacterium]
MSTINNPLQSLRKGNWFKLICGASFQDLPAVRNLTLAYTLAGADCIDVAADPAAIVAAKEGLAAASQVSEIDRQPWLMVSLNDAEDPHFRKAEFDPACCPADCPRPCERICPADAIVFDTPSSLDPLAPLFSGVVDRRCYGCGRCLPICPIGAIGTRSYVSAPSTVAPVLLDTGVDAVEIHTQVGHGEDFQRLWQAIEPCLDRLQLVAVSCPDHPDLIDYLRSIVALISELPCALVWQTDGRPMSGDLGAGTTRAAIALSQKVLAAELPGYVQLAGGTNDRTVPKLQQLGLLPMGETQRSVAGVAYGSYARKLLSPTLNQLEQVYLTKSQLMSPLAPSISLRLEDYPNLLAEAVERARFLVSQLKPQDELWDWEKALANFSRSQPTR